MRDEVDFLSADKQKSVLQDDSIALGVCSKTCSKYRNEQFHNIFAISQKRR